MNGIDIGLLVLVVVVVFALVEYREWSQRDEDRRIERLRERGRA